MLPPNYHTVFCRPLFTIGALPSTIYPFNIPSIKTQQSTVPTPLDRADLNDAIPPVVPISTKDMFSAKLPVATTSKSMQGKLMFTLGSAWQPDWPALPLSSDERLANNMNLKGTANNIVVSPQTQIVNLNCHCTLHNSLSYLDLLSSPCEGLMPVITTSRSTKDADIQCLSSKIDNLATTIASNAFYQNMSYPFNQYGQQFAMITHGQRHDQHDRQFAMIIERLDTIGDYFRTAKWQDAHSDDIDALARNARIVQQNYRRSKSISTQHVLEPLYKTVSCHSHYLSF